LSAFSPRQMTLEKEWMKRETHVTSVGVLAARWALPIV
jgi:hypothetical protein